MPCPKAYRIGKSASDEVLDRVRTYFTESWLITSTRAIYSGDDLSGRFVHNYGSIVVKPSKLNEAGVLGAASLFFKFHR